MRLKDKISIITGAASGYGREIAHTYAREGAKVVIADINGQGAREVARDIGASATHVPVDVTDKRQVQAMVDHATKTFGGLDVMVNNAGYTHDNQSLTETPEHEFDRTFAVNVKSIYLATLAVVPEMKKRGGGVIITTASTAGVRPRPGLVWYAGSKGAAIALTKGLAAELAPHKIRVCAINPVIGETGLTEKFMGTRDTPENRARFVATIPLGRFSRPSDIANAALFLADPASDLITGVALEVDGGRCI